MSTSGYISAPPSPTGVDTPVVTRGKDQMESEDAQCPYSSNAGTAPDSPVHPSPPSEDDHRTPTVKRSGKGRLASGEHSSASPAKKLKMPEEIPLFPPTKESRVSAGIPSDSMTDKMKKKKKDYFGPNALKHPRKFRRWVVNRRGYSEDDVKEVFRIYDWQKGREDQDPETLDRIGKLFNLRGARWPTQGIKAAYLGAKTVSVLHEIMEGLGWVHGYGARNEKTGRMTITFAPADPKHPRIKGLPSWLPYDALVLDTKDDIVSALKRIRLQTASGETGSERIRTGSGLFQKSEDLVHQGTVGAIVEDKPISATPKPSALL